MIHREANCVSCVGTIHNVVPRPLLQIVCVTGHIQTLLCSCGEGGGRLSGDNHTVWAFCFLPSPRGDSLANLLQ